MRRVHVLIVLVAVSMVMGVSACNRSRTGSAGRPAGEKYGKYILHSTKYDDAQRGKAKDNAADVLTQLQGEEHVCLVGLWAYNPPAILKAVKEAKREGKVKIVGFDEDDETLLGIKDGHIHATVVQQPFKFGYESVRVLKDMGKKNVGFVTNNAADFWTIAEAGTRKASEEFGVQVQFRRPRNATAADQKEIIEDLLNKGVDGIAISVLQPESQHDFLNQVAAKVPLITQDNDAPKTNRKHYIGTDNYKAGRAVGELVKEVMPEGGTIAIFVGQPDPLNARQRRQGVLDALAGVETAGAGDAEGQGIIHVPHRVIKKNNPDKDNDVENFMAELKRLLGK
jgi:ribose transport system substrate-binding protein